jgi:hypothetical protein
MLEFLNDTHRGIETVKVIGKRIGVEAFTHALLCVKQLVLKIGGLVHA